MTETTRPQAQRLNPLIGISQKDTVSQVSSFLRAISQSTLNEDLIPILAEVAAAALEHSQNS